MRHSGHILANTLKLIKENIRPGVTTGQLDEIAFDYIKSQNALPSFKGYGGFPASICASVNNQVIHGIPGIRKLIEGDIISIDIGVYYNGYHTDAARTYPVGIISKQAEDLIKVTKNSFFKGIENAIEGKRISDISHAIQKYAESKGYSVVRDFVGHGIGRKLHEDPSVPNFGKPGKGQRLTAGMTLAIEPMINQGDFGVMVLSDNWTVETRDNKLSSHYENTVLITKGEPEILTIMENEVLFNE